MSLHAHPAIDIIEENDRSFHLKGDDGRYLDLETMRQNKARRGHRVGYKAPRETHHIDQYMASIPGLRVIWLRRDLHQVVASMLALRWKNKESWASRNAPREVAKHVARFDDCAGDLRESIEDLRPEERSVGYAALCGAVKSGHRDRFVAEFPTASLVVDYEDLVTAPQTSTAAMLTHVGVRWNDAVLSHHAQPELFADRRLAGQADASRPIDQTSLEKWRTLPTWTLQLVDAVEAAYQTETDLSWK